MAECRVQGLKPRQDSSSFDPAAFVRLFKVERTHFWFRARNEVIAAVMRRRGIGTNRDDRILEVGCGNGNVAKHLSETLGAEVWGGDLHPEGLAFSQQRSNAPLLQLDTVHLPFDGSLDAVCMFDVLEHLQADSEILAEVYRALKPGGRIVLTVPAHPWLWSYFDQVSHHQRRYKKGELHQKLLTAGFQIEMCSYYMMALMPLVLLGRRFQAWRQSDIDRMADADLRVIPVINEVMYWICSAEKWLVSRVGIPIGTSLIAVGRRN